MAMLSVKGLLAKVVGEIASPSQRTANAVINALGTATSTAFGDGDAYIITENVDGTHGTFYRRPISAVWTWVAGKIRSTFGFTSANILARANGGTGTDNTARTANTVLAGPSSGSAGNSTWRALVAADLPSIPSSKLTGAVAVANGGTGFVGSATYDVASKITQSSTASGNFKITSATLSVWGMVAQLRVAFQVKAALTAGTEYALGTLNSAIRPQVAANAGVGDRRMFATCESAGGLYVRPEVAMSASTTTTYYFQSTYILESAYTG